MATGIDEIGREKKQAEISPARRDYFTVSEFWKIRSLLPDYELELINGEITVNKRSSLQFISIEDFEKVADEFPDQSVWAHTEPSDSRYVVCEPFKGDQVLPAPGLDFFRIASAQIFEET